RRMALKSELRTLYKKKRQALDAVTFATLQEQILEVFSTLRFSGIRYCHYFLPIKHFHEPDTHLFMDWLSANHPDIHQVTSKIVPGTFNLLYYDKFSVSNITVNAWGIPEPGDGIEVQAHLLD